jgi:hypothetical protein
MLMPTIYPLVAMTMKDKIREAIKKRAVNDRLPCPVAREIAEESAVSVREVGEIANDLGIKITDCELGCF